MIVRKLLVVLFFSTKTSEASVFSMTGLSSLFYRMKVTPPLALTPDPEESADSIDSSDSAYFSDSTDPSDSAITPAQDFSKDNIQNEQVNEINSPKPLILSGKTKERVNEPLRASLDQAIKVAVKDADTKIRQAFISGATIAQYGHLDATNLVLTAIELKAYDLLKLLQIIYIWRDDAQFHWFQARSYLSPWYDEKMWNTYGMKWENHLEAVCEHDNGDLAEAIQKRGLMEITSGQLEEELLKMCVEHDAIKVFEAFKILPFQLGKYIELMSVKSSAKLLQLYKTTIGIGCLKLGKFPFPEKLADDVTSFEFLLEQGHGRFRMDRFITMSCEKRRLDLLVYLYKLDPILVPTEQNFEFVAEKGWLEIVEWAYQSKILDEHKVKCVAVKLAINRHFQALDWLICTSEVIFDTFMIDEISKTGSLEALQWIIQRQSIDQSQQQWADSAAENRHLPVLQWLYCKFELLPTIKSLKNATIEMLDWIEAVDTTMEITNLLYYETDNLELLQWIFKSAKNFDFRAQEKELKIKVRSKNMMVWICDNLKIRSFNMDWAYATGDLRTIKLARKYHISPTEENVYYAVKNNHLDIIRWITMHYAELLQTPRLLQVAIHSGSLRTAKFLVSVVGFGEREYRGIHPNVCGDQRLAVLKWAHENKYNLGSWFADEMDLDTRQGYLQIILWLNSTFYRIPYAWEKVCKNFKTAFENGHLDIITEMLNCEPTLINELANVKITSLNYHIKQRFLLKEQWPERTL